MNNNKSTVSTLGVKRVEIDNKDAKEENLMCEGFHRLDKSIIELKPPNITWLSGFEDREPNTKIEYLKKLASTMNHAAKLISMERDSIIDRVNQKDEQLNSMRLQIESNNEMLVKAVTQMNEQRQGYNKEVARLNAIIRELEK